MDEKDTIYDYDTIKDLSDEELYQRLYEYWNIGNDKIQVWGRLQLVSPRKQVMLYDAKLITDNRDISYPISISENNNLSI